jgi:hypothetical protein
MVRVSCTKVSAKGRKLYVEGSKGARKVKIDLAAARYQRYVRTISSVYIGGKARLK